MVAPMRGQGRFDADHDDDSQGSYDSQEASYESRSHSDEEGSYSEDDGSYFDDQRGPPNQKEESYSEEGSYSEEYSDEQEQPFHSKGDTPRNIIHDDQDSQYSDERDSEYSEGQQSKGSQYSDEQGSQYDDESDSQYDDEQGSQYDDEQGSQYDDEQGSQYDDEQGSQYDDEQGSRYDDEQGSQYDDEQGSQYDDEQGSQYSDEQGSKYSDDQGPQHNDGRGSQHSDQQDSRYSDEQGSQYSDEQGSQYSDEQGSQYSDEQGSQYSDEQGSQYSDEQGSQYSDEQGSQYSDEQQYADEQGIHQTNKRDSQHVEDGERLRQSRHSFHSDEGSDYSGEEGSYVDEDIEADHTTDHRLRPNKNFYSEEKHRFSFRGNNGFGDERFVEISDSESATDEGAENGKSDDSSGQQSPLPQTNGFRTQSRSPTNKRDAGSRTSQKSHSTSSADEQTFANETSFRNYQDSFTSAASTFNTGTDTFHTGADTKPSTLSHPSLFSSTTGSTGVPSFALDDSYTEESESVPSLPERKLPYHQNMPANHGGESSSASGVDSFANDAESISSHPNYELDFAHRESHTSKRTENSPAMGSTGSVSSISVSARSKQTSIKQPFSARSFATSFAPPSLATGSINELSMTEDNSIQTSIERSPSVQTPTEKRTLPSENLFADSFVANAFDGFGDDSFQDDSFFGGSKVQSTKKTMDDNIESPVSQENPYVDETNANHTLRGSKSARSSSFRSKISTARSLSPPDSLHSKHRNSPSNRSQSRSPDRSPKSAFKTVGQHTVLKATTTPSQRTPQVAVISPEEAEVPGALTPIGSSPGATRSKQKRRTSEGGIARIPNRASSGYTREQLRKFRDETRETDGDSQADKNGKVKKKRPRASQAKNKALLNLVAKINDVLVELEDSDKYDATESSASAVFRGFEELVGILLQISDELEVLQTFKKSQDNAAITAMHELLSYAEPLEEIFDDIEEVVKHYVYNEIDEDMDDFLSGISQILSLLSDVSHQAGQSMQWNERINCVWATLLEMLARDGLEMNCIHDDIETPEFELSEDIEVAWNETGHVDEFKILEVTEDLAVFRQICYVVILSCDQWCPDIDALMDVCGIDDSMLEEILEPDPEDELAPTPESALAVLEKITAEGLSRSGTLGYIIRRVLPAGEVSDEELANQIPTLNATIRNTLGLPTSTMVAISSAPESTDNPSALGFAGVGKTTFAALVADNKDVRRFFNDGIAWVYIGQFEMTYHRYVQCLRDVLSQIFLDEGEIEPLFPELLHTPGESQATRRRREEGFMIFVRESMIEFLRYKNVLIILDDVCFESDLDWFDFDTAATSEEEPEDDVGTCVVLATTRRRNLMPIVDTVEVDLLDESESLELLVSESGPLDDPVVLSDSSEAQAIVVECANHLLTVKTVGKWLSLMSRTSGIHSSLAEVFENIMSIRGQADADMMFEVLNQALSPLIKGERTKIMKLCLAGFVRVFCDKKFISDFSMADASPSISLRITETFIESILDLEEDALLKEGSLVDTPKAEVATVILDALSALGIFKVEIRREPEELQGDEKKEDEDEDDDDKYIQIMHTIQQEYGEFLCEQDDSLAELTKESERRWNRAFAQAFLRDEIRWDSEKITASLDYALEMMPSHMIRGEMFLEAKALLCDKQFIRGRFVALGRENGTRRFIKDCEHMSETLVEQKALGRRKGDPKVAMKDVYKALDEHLPLDDGKSMTEKGSLIAMEVGRAHIELGFSLAEKRCWEAAIFHWEQSQELFVSSLGMVEIVAGILYNVGVAFAELNDYEQSLDSLKQCLKIRGAIHGEKHILYAQTIQKIGDIFLAMSDFHEAMESYNWALDVMHVEPNHHRIDIGNILENQGKIYYSKGEIEESLQCYQDSLRSKQVDLGNDHPELSSTYHQIGNCLSDQGKTKEAIAHFKEAIRLKKLDAEGGPERDADILTIEGVLHNLCGEQQEGLKCYEKALQILVTQVPHMKEKVASLLHLIGCVYLVGGEHKKALKLFEESLQARRKVLGFVHLDVASTLFNMAFLHQSLDKPEKALKCLEEALKIRQLRLPDSEKVAMTHEKIGRLAKLLGKTKKAEIAFTEALRIRKQIHGENHEAVATVLQELGDLLDDLGEYDEAMKNYVEALGIRETRLGEDDLAVAETFYSMGFTLQNIDALDKALNCFEDSLQIRKFQLGDDAKEVGDTLNMMGFVQAKRGELDEALSFLWDALRIRKLQQDHVKVSETLKNIGNVHREKLEFDYAVECYEECLRIRKVELGGEHEKVADALMALANVRSDMDQSDQAMPAYKEALRIRTVLFGEQDESVAAVLHSMGALQFKIGKLEQAFTLLDEFVRIRKENSVEHDGDYVNVLIMIGNIHKMQEREEEAKKCWTEAYKIIKKLGLAQGNPQIAEVMANLVKDEDMEDPQKYQDEADHKNAKGILGRLTEKVKGAAAVKRKDRGHQL